MAIVRTDDKHYKAIADVIRNQPGYTDNYTPEQMPSIITSAMVDANAAGMIAGYDDGYVLGKQAQYDEFWEGYCNTINTAYTGGFGAFAGPSWNKENCKPTKDLKPRYTYLMFGYNGFIEDLDEWAEECGITIDFSKSQSFTYTFYSSGSTLKSVGIINTQNSTYLAQTFYGAAGLHTIKNLILKDDGSQTITSIFNGCTSLANLTITGKIGQNGFDVKSCPITHESLMSIIEALFDHTTTGYARTVTLGSTNIAKLTDAEKAIATQKGWTLI